MKLLIFGLSSAQTIGGIFALVLAAFSAFFFFSTARKGAENIPDTPSNTPILQSTLKVVDVVNGVVSGYDEMRGLYVTFKALEGYSYTNGAIYKYTYIANQVNDVKTI